jgi:membrane-associated protease RseP (regulator of RpoE activity)
LKEFLSSKGIRYEDHDVNTDPVAAQEAVRLTGQNGVPVTVIDGQTVVGFDQPRLEWLLVQARTQADMPPKFGAAVADVGKAAGKGVSINFGAYVGRIKPGSIAEKAGLAVGDVIIHLNTRSISSAADLEQFIAEVKQGDMLSIVFIRGNAVNTAEVTA